MNAIHTTAIEHGLGPVADVRGIADFLFTHAWDEDEGRCECGWVYFDDDGNFTHDHKVHVAEQLKATFDIRSKDLPE